MELLKQLKEEPCICVTPTTYKKRILQALSSESHFYHIQFLNKEELKKQLLYEYHKEALWKLTKEFNLLPENGAIILEAMYAITSEEQSSSLYQKKEWLKEQNLLITHAAFLAQLKKQKVYIYGYDSYEMKFLEHILSKYTEVKYFEEENNSYLPEITEYETIEQEVIGTFEKISQLLVDGISPNHIYLGMTNSDYKSILSKVSYYFRIPIETKDNHFLFEYEIIQQFLSMIDWNQPLSMLEEIIEQLKKSYPDNISFHHEIYDSIITIINPYYQKNRPFKEIKDILLYELKHTKVKRETYSNIIKEVDFKTTLFDTGDYIFLMGANLGEFPPIYENQDYFSDKEKELLFLPTSLEMTSGEEAKIRKKIESLPHVFLSYKKKSPFKEYLPSSLIEQYREKKNIIIEKCHYQYSNKAYNEYLLNSSLDEFVNFNYQNEHLSNLYGIESLYYNSYDNQFTGIQQKLFEKYVPYCVLSYTGMQKFFECPFKYYVGSILKITPPFEESPSLIVGNLFHAILEQYFQNKENLEPIINQELSKIEMTPDEKKEFYFQKYRMEIKRLILLMEQQLERSSFTPTYFEETIEWLEHKNITFKIFGKIDKIMTVEDEENSYIIVIDYKTGHSTSDLSKVIYGMNMQLLLYLYLISKDNRFSKYQLGGAYIESISSSIPNYTEKKTLDELLWEQSKLDGITLKRTEFVSRLDNQYMDSSYIKGVRMKKDGDFYQSNRLLEPYILEQLLEIVKKNIEEVEEKVGNAQFAVMPKKFSSEIKEQVSSCAYCNYRDICYLKPKNIKTLKEYKNLEFLERGENYDT